MLRQLLRGAARAGRAVGGPAAATAWEGSITSTSSTSSTLTASLTSSSSSSSLDALAGRLGRITLRGGKAMPATAASASPPPPRQASAAAESTAPTWLRPPSHARAFSTSAGTATATDGAAPPPPPPPPPSSSSSALPPNLELAVPEALEAFKPEDPAEAERRLHLLVGAVPPGKLTLPVLPSLTNDAAMAEGTTSVRLDPRVFAVPVRKDIVHRVVTWQRAKRRLGLAMTKRVGDIRGSTKKYRQQKGSGRARARKKHAPQFRGGYKPHGPVQRDFSFKLNKKVRALGLRVALSAKLREGNLVIAEHLQLPESRTKVLDSALKQYEWASDAEGRRRGVLLIDGDAVPPSLELAVRNLPYAKALPQVGANVMDIVRAEVLVLSQAAVDALTARLLP